jgi:DNA sulfur modification protein DndC
MQGETTRLASSKNRFEQEGKEQVVSATISEIQQLYLADKFPWIVGYSGGKDSTATLQLVWKAIDLLPQEQRHKKIHVISTDTLVENPIVAQWVTLSLDRMKNIAEAANLPIIPHRLTPSVEDSFWVNLIGKGYPAPRPKFRWCTSRLKINASNNFITDLLKEYGETTLVLGTRSQESAVRNANMKHYEEVTAKARESENQLEVIATDDVRNVRVINGNIPGSWVYTPVGNWSTDDVWIYINSEKNPWGHPNTDLLTMYQGATEGGECPLVVDSSTQSCGDSRFGCYVCTMVEQDKSMTAMINNDEEKEWMTPLMDFRNKMLDIKNDREHPDMRRMNGSLMVHNDRLVKGPYKQYFREELLRELLLAQKTIAEIAPDNVAELILVRPEELEEIRRVWIQEKHEIEDRLPQIYAEVFGACYEGVAIENPMLTNDQLDLLKSVCLDLGDEDGYRYETLRKMLVTQHQYSKHLKRVGIFDELWAALEKGVFEDEASAEQYALTRREQIVEAGEQATEQQAQPDFYNAEEGASL